MHKRKTRGFTLIEVLIVIVIIAILAAITVLVYRGIQQRARNASRIQTASSFRKSLEIVMTKRRTINDLLVTHAGTPFPTACYSKGLPTVMGSSAGDCHWWGDGTLIADETPLTAELEKHSGTVPPGQVYPKIVQGDGTTYLAPFVYVPIIDGVSKQPVIEYSLEGNGVDCGLRPVVNYNPNTPPNHYSMNTNGNNYSIVEDGGKYTSCIIRVNAEG